MAGAGAKLFTSGSVLTAAQVNTYLMDQAVMRFADEAARDAAFGGGGEPTLAEGMFAYTDDTNTLWFYTGSVWEVATIKPSLVDAKGDLLAGTAADTVDRLAVGTDGQVLVADSSTSTGLAWGSAGGLVLVKTQVIGSAVATVEVTDAFSSTYDNYLITVSDGQLSGDSAVRMILGATTAGYYLGLFGVSFAGAAGVATVNNGAIWSFIGYGGTTGINVTANLQMPNLAKKTFIQAPYINTGGGSANLVTGYLNNTTQYTAFTLSPGAGTMTGGTIRVYGYANS